MNLENQIAVITGGASGMGKACAQLLSARGVKVVVWDKQVSSQDKVALALNVDVSSAKEVEEAAKETVAVIGLARICINCAGIAPAKRMVGKEAAMSLDLFKEVIDVNLIGSFNVMRVLAFLMSKEDCPAGMEERGVIINTASIAAFDGQIGQAAYSASKGGIVAMTLPVARELAQFGIRVNAIAPGLIATPMLLNMPQAVQDNLKAKIPFPKRFGQPNEFAALVCHIIENSLINGEVIRLDGALRMPFD